MSAAPVLLLAEYLALFLGLGVLFDIDALANLPDAWRMVFWNGSLLVGGLVATFAALLSIAGKPIRKSVARHAPQAGPVALGWLALHGLIYGVFLWISLTALSDAGFAIRGGIALLMVWIGLAGLLIYSAFRGFLGQALTPIVRDIAPMLILAAILGTTVTLIASTIYPYWTLLSRPTLHLTVAILTLCCGDAPVDLSINAIYYGSFPVIIDSTCSGIEGMGMITVFLTGYLLAYRKEHRFPHALILFPAGLGLSFLANSVRIATLIVIGDKISPELAKSAFHSMAGWIFFALLTLLLVTAAQNIRWLRRDNARIVRQAAPEVSAYLIPFLVWLAVGLLGGALSVAAAQNADPFYPLRVGLVVLLLWQYRRFYAIAEGSGREDTGAIWQKAVPWMSGLAVYGVWMLLIPHSDVDAATRPAIMADWAPVLVTLWILLRVLGSVVVVPVIEELAFRGFLQRRLIAADFTSVSYRRLSVVSVAVSALAFGVLHGQWIAGTVAGVMFSLIAAVRDRLSDAVIAHAVANALIAATVLGFGRWDLW